jgi:hypothetical protein
MPSTPNFVTGGFGAALEGFRGPINRNTSTRDQYRGDLNLYTGAHEIKLGGDYQDARSHAVYSYSGGQLIKRYNDRGQTYYEHDFFAASPTDLTPVDSPVNPRTKDYGIYAQDSWRVLPGLTVNAGLRWDQEDIRDYRDVSVIKTTGEWQPRLGLVWDPGKDGRTKVYGFAGRFYYSLPADLSVRAYGASTNATTFNFDSVSVVQNENVLGHETARIVGNALSEPVDVGLKGIYQDEYTIGVERLLDPTFSVALKGTYRTLGRAIEDRCDLDYFQESSSCAIVNPGSNGKYARGDFYSCTGLDFPYDNCTDDRSTDRAVFGAAPTPEARRIYRGIEILGRSSLSEKFWLQASYLYSSVRGNYDGEVSQVLLPQTDPGINTDFDFPAFSHDAYGRLHQDRPHNLRFDGYYAMPWRLWIGVQAYVQSGPPQSRVGYFNGALGGNARVELVPKGYEGRLPTAWEASLTVGYPLALGPVIVTAQLYVSTCSTTRSARHKTWPGRRAPRPTIPGPSSTRTRSRIIATTEKPPAARSHACSAEPSVSPSEPFGRAIESRQSPTILRWLAKREAIRVAPTQ